jgi:hypothetical protein
MCGLLANVSHSLPQDLSGRFRATISGSSVPGFGRLLPVTTLLPVSTRSGPWSTSALLHSNRFLWTSCHDETGDQQQYRDR